MTDKRTILIIDDDETLRESIADLFRLSGFQVLEAASGEQGLAMAHQQRPDIIISDLMLPGLDGVEVRKHLLQTPEGSIPFVFISAKADVHSILQEHGLGQELFLPKPFDSLKLVEMVDQILIHDPGR